MPDEILTHIFSFVPNHSSVREVCKRFNEISCQMKYFKIQLKSMWNDSYARILEDDETFKSMLMSHRRIKSVEISRESEEDDEVTEDQSERLIEVARYFGENVTSLELNGNVLSSVILKLADLFPNVEIIKLNNIEKTSGKIPEVFELNLRNLREIQSSNCNHNVLKYFCNLPAGVIRRLEIIVKENCGEPEQSVKLFQRQQNVKEIVACTSFIKFIDLGSMKLQMLTLKGPKVQLSGIINGQSEMKKLVVEGIFENDLELICNELKSLKHLDISAVESQASEFAQLVKLSKLEFLKLSFNKAENSALNQCLTFLENRNLQTLEIYSYHNEICVETIESLGLNCPKLKKLKITSRSQLNIMNSVINFLPSLTDLEMNGLTEKPESPFNFAVEKFHQNLKKLVLVGLKTENREFVRLINTLENLVELRISKPISHDTFQDILLAHPRLKIFDMSPQWHLITHDHIFTEEFANVLKTHGRQLDVFRGLFRFIDKGIAIADLENELKQTHKSVCIEDLLAFVEVIMEK